MQQLQQRHQNVAEHVLCGQLGILVRAVQPGLGQFDIPVAVGVPDEVIDLGGGHAELVGIHILGDFFDERIEL